MCESRECDSDCRVYKALRKTALLSTRVKTAAGAQLIVHNGMCDMTVTVAISVKTTKIDAVCACSRPLYHQSTVSVPKSSRPAVASESEEQIGHPAAHAGITWGCGSLQHVLLRSPVVGRGE